MFLLLVIHSKSCHSRKKTKRPMLLVRNENSHIKFKHLVTKITQKLIPQSWNVPFFFSLYKLFQKIPLTLCFISVPQRACWTDRSSPTGRHGPSVQTTARPAPARSDLYRLLLSAFASLLCLSANVSASCRQVKYSVHLLGVPS